jgi:hypothetical protein
MFITIKFSDVLWGMFMGFKMLWPLFVIAILGIILENFILKKVNAYKNRGLTKCPDCEKYISKNAHTCPACGNQVKPVDIIINK